MLRFLDDGIRGTMAFGIHGLGLLFQWPPITMEHPKPKPGYLCKKLALTAFRNVAIKAGWLKHVLGLRQFLLRGLEKVPDGVAVGVYRLQSENTDPCGGTTARRVRRFGYRRGKLKKLGASRPPFFRAEDGLTSGFGFGKSFRSFRSSKKT
jgi:hypothetical protein